MDRLGCDASTDGRKLLDPHSTHGRIDNHDDPRALEGKAVVLGSSCKGYGPDLHNVVEVNVAVEADPPPRVLLGAPRVDNVENVGRSLDSQRLSDRVQDLLSSHQSVLWPTFHVPPALHDIAKTIEVRDSERHVKSSVRGFILDVTVRPTACRRVVLAGHDLKYAVCVLALYLVPRKEEVPLRRAPNKNVTTHAGPTRKHCSGPVQTDGLNANSLLVFLGHRWHHGPVSIQHQRGGRKSPEEL
mmetsp:Transcript_23249/g.58753  ORF Transcript_23249/g.58753 Transcript_23249/m.58753 type:complete len:243 (+) Transcript_23249:664-1392(+)